MGPLGRCRSLMEKNIEMVFQKVGLGVDWNYLAEDANKRRAAVNTVMKQSSYIKCGIFVD